MIRLIITKLMLHKRRSALSFTLNHSTLTVLCLLAFLP